MIEIYAAIKGGFRKITIGEEAILEAPDLCYLLTQEGLMLKNFNRGHHIIKPAVKVPFDKIEPIQKTFYPVISYEIHRQSLAFLKAIYKKQQTEACILLLLDRDKPLTSQEYVIYIPKQECKSAHVHYVVNYDEIPNNLFLAASIHSHPSFGASQSSTDHKDEFQFDGIHITYGKINLDNFEVHARICLNGKVYDSSTPLIEIVPKEKEFVVPQEWIEKAEEEKKIITGFQNGEVPEHYGWNPAQTIISGRSGATNIIGEESEERRQKETGERGKLALRRAFNAMKPKSPINQKNSSTLKNIIEEDDLCLVYLLSGTVE